MNCSKCGNVMIKGKIPVHRGRLYWTSEENRIPWNIFKLPKGSIVLSDPTYSTPKYAESWYCNSCELVVTPVQK